MRDRHERDAQTASFVMRPSATVRHIALLVALAAGVAARANADEATGLVHHFNYTGEVFADIDGGIRSGAVYTGLLQGTLDWHRGSWTAHGDVYFPHGDSLTQRDVGDFSVVSNIDAVHQLRVHELWGQRLMGPVSVRLGLLALDTEFWGSDTAALFVSSAFGAPSVISGNLPHSPIYPQGVLGARVAFEAGKHDSVRVALIDGDGGDPASVNRHGLRIDFNHGALLVVEDQHLFGTVDAPTARARFGVFVRTRDSTDIDGPSARGTWGMVGVIDRAISKHLTWFARAGVAEHDRSTVPWSVETGLNLGSVFAPRNTLGLAFAYIDLNGRLPTSDNLPGLRHEAIVEGTLNVPLDERITLQPDLQYIFDPGGTANARNALVAGVRISLALEQQAPSD